MGITIQEISKIPRAEIQRSIAKAIPKIDAEVKTETQRLKCPVLTETLKETSRELGSLTGNIFGSSTTEDKQPGRCPFSRSGIVSNIVETVSNLVTFIKSAWQNKKDLIELTKKVLVEKTEYMKWLRDVTPRKNIRPVFMPFGTHYLVPYESFRNDICLSRGDGSGINLGKYKADGKEYDVVLHTPKLGRFYEQFSEIVGREGLLWSVDNECWRKASSLIDRKNFLTPGAVMNYEPQIIKIYKNKTLETEKELASLRGAQNLNLKEKSKEAVLEILNQCILGNIPKKYWKIITNDFFQCAKDRMWGRLFSPLSLPQIISRKTKSGLDALKGLDHISLLLLSDRLKELENRKPENLLDILALEAAKKIKESYDPQKSREEILKITKIYLELAVAGHASNINSKGFFDYEALSNEDFRAQLVKAIDDLNCSSLEEMVKKVTDNPELLEPFEAAAYSSFAHYTAIPAFTRQGEFYLEDENGEKRLMTEFERIDFAQNCSNPLSQIPQHGPILFPIIGYTNIALRDNGFLTEDGDLNSKAIFQNGTAEVLKNIANTESFGQGQRKCIGSAPALSIIKWGAFFTAYLLWKFPDLKLARNSKTIISNLYGKKEVLVKRA